MSFMFLLSNSPRSQTPPFGNERTLLQEEESFPLNASEHARGFFTPIMLQIYGDDAGAIAEKDMSLAVANILFRVKGL